MYLLKWSHTEGGLDSVFFRLFHRVYAVSGNKCQVIGILGFLMQSFLKSEDSV